MVKSLLLFPGLFFICTSLYSQTKEYIISDIHIIGNKTTKEKIILRELTFKKGDTISDNLREQMIYRSRENVLNTSLFNYVTITSSDSLDGNIDICVSVEERWYTWPAVIFKYDDRNFSAWLKSKDLSKTKYGFSLERYNFLGRKQNLRFSFLFGYATQFSLSYKNISLDKNRKHFIGADLELTKQDEVIFNTIENEPVTYRSNFHSVFERRKYTINYLYRPFIYDMHNFYLNYFEFNIADTIIKFNPDYLGSRKSHLECFTLDYVYSNDKRDIKAYPLHGSYFELLIGQTVSTPFSKKSFSSTVVIPSFYKYFELRKNLFYATGINIKFSYNNSYSYLYSRALGYTLNLHGFEYNTIEGQYLIAYKNLLKFTVIKQRVTEISFIPLEKFKKVHYALYFNVFSDCGYVSNKYKTPDNSYSNKFLFSTGAGFDLVTYYDRTLRIEYSLNGFGRGGLYFHITAPLNK
jgi:outer membrane protein assembly factor BamA